MCDRANAWRILDCFSWSVGESLASLYLFSYSFRLRTLRIANHTSELLKDFRYPTAAGSTRRAVPGSTDVLDSWCREKDQVLDTQDGKFGLHPSPGALEKSSEAIIASESTSQPPHLVPSVVRGLYCSLAGRESD